MEDKHEAQDPPHAQRTAIAFVRALVRFPLYEGDTQESDWNWFEYREPGITPQGEIGVCSRPVTVLRAEIIPAPSEEDT